MDRPSIVKASQILTVSKERLEKQLGKLSDYKLNEVECALKLSLSIS